MSYLNLNERTLKERGESENLHMAVKTRWIASCDPRVEASASAIVELMEVRTGQLVSILDRQEASRMLDHICVH